MTSHGSANLRGETSKQRAANSTNREQTSDSNKAVGSRTPQTKPHVIDASLKRRARLLITNSSIPGPTRSLLRYALHIKDPYLAQVVRRVEAGELTIDHLHLE